MLRRSKGKDGDGRRAGVDSSGVVVAGDDPDALELMGRILAATGEPVQLFADKASAVATVTTQPCRAFVLAFAGGPSGSLSLVDTIRNHADAAVRSTPIVLLADDDKNLTYAWQSGIDAHLLRPVHADVLVATVNDAMTRSESERSDHRRTELRRAQAAALADPDDA
jgi:DNA-binding response OmpR family regulator